MLDALRSLWVLFLGLAILMVGAGMSHTLLTLRGTAEGFTTVELGLMQTSFQLGLVLATLVAAPLIRQVGHIRVFSAMAALNSALIVLHILWIDPWVWAFERVLMGMCTAILMIVCESWLSDMTPNAQRSQIFSMYTIISWGAPIVGISALAYGDINSPNFFILATIMISIAVVPMLLSVSRTPVLVETERLSLSMLYAKSPLGVLGAFVSGAIQVGFYSTVIIFALASGYSKQEAIILNMLALGGGLLFQWPIAWLSDHYDRRLVLGVIAALGAVLGLLFSIVPNTNFYLAMVAVTLLSALILSLYNICVAHTTDYLKPTQILPASGTLVMLYGVGSVISPITLAPLIEQQASYYYLGLGLMMSALALFVAYRMTRRDAVTSDEMGDELLATSMRAPYAGVYTVTEEWDEVDNIDTSQAKYDRTDGRPDAADDNPTAPLPTDRK